MFQDSITKSIAEAAKGIMNAEGLNLPGAANNAIYRDVKGTTPIADAETGKNATEDCDEPGCEDDDGSAIKEDSFHCEVCGCLLDRDNEDVFCTNCASEQHPGISESAHDVKVGSELSINGAWWIVDSIDGDTAYISDQDGAEDEIAIGKSNYEVVKEGVEEPRAGVEKTFKQMHSIEASDNTDAEKQEGTEAMDDSDPARPVGTKLEGTQKDGEADDAKVAKTIAGSVQPGQAQAPKAKGTPQAGAESTKGLKDTTKGGSQSAKAPKASGVSQPGSESAKAVKNTAPDGTLKAKAPKAGQVSPEPTPAGLKESIKGVINEASSNVIKIMLLVDKLNQKEAEELFDELAEWHSQAAEDMDEPKCKEISKLLDRCTEIMSTMNLTESARQVLIEGTGGVAESPWTHETGSNGLHGMSTHEDGHVFQWMKNKQDNEIYGMLQSPNGKLIKPSAGFYRTGDGEVAADTAYKNHAGKK